MPHSWQLPVCWDTDNGVPSFSPALSQHAVVGCINLYSRVQILKRVNRITKTGSERTLTSAPECPPQCSYLRGVWYHTPILSLPPYSLVITTHNMQA